MGWKYAQASGELTSPAGSRVGLGYSGRGAGLNNPAMQAVCGEGPIPRGVWTISEFFDDPHGKGPMVARLAPAEGTDALGRDGFMIHGDNRAANHTASEGCIVLPPMLRAMILASGVRVLTVVE